MICNLYYTPPTAECGYDTPHHAVSCSGCMRGGRRHDRSLRKYLQLLQQHDIAVRCGVVFGSQVTGKTHTWSDIDLLVVSPCFDTAYDYRLVDLLWRLSARVDSRIEPIPCGERQWEEDDASAVVEIARRHGAQVSVDDVAAPTRIPTTDS